MLVAKQPAYLPQPPLRQPAQIPKVKPQALERLTSRHVFILVALLAIGLMAFAVTYRSISINDMQSRISKLERSIQGMEKENTALTIRLKQLSTPRQIEGRANEELGMNWPAQKQIVSVIDFDPEY